MNDSESSINGRVPPLTQLCQRAAASYAESITTLGDNLSYSLVKPILERCSAEQLLKLEESSPHIQDDSLELWVQLCIRKYPTAVGRYLDDDSLEPISWRERYMILKREEESRFERLGSKLKAQRLEAEERKKEREVKLTDRVPPPKRPRSGGWGAPTQPKTLLQKTLSEASKIQKAMYNSRSIPPMANGRSYRVLAKDTSPIIPESKSVVTSRVCVNTVQKRLVCGPSRTSKVPTSLPQLPSNANTSPMSQARHGSAPSNTTLKTTVPESPCKRLGAPSNSPPDGRPMKTMVSVKKDPMAALFLPKHRAHSQRPV
ncbi:hypothetical protein AGABI2DRAFT_199007 [Agaricus bisporus var. bisporus H97]|uniref:hypothetical protein n=1 Tax=Agaricus bisporus var. bisporus (strain H97 / ATCC MYA-4626 / FGSC 10389) TaxID=936046 RepID=UPI00029F6FC5|nr:hypothetical protein AGABI2DRAFT_199007 [Agaricus bisporus var. bisporus H97]EKV49878.1 hypothetical protein AGABI2DRAFT_199007 [Agaricus bisporus var. bisporus H97]